MPTDAPLASLCFVTIPVSCLKNARAFYTDILGMGISREYPPTNWMSVDLDESDNGSGLGLVEVEGYVADDKNLVRVDFFVDDLDSYWDSISEHVNCLSAPENTPWGSYKAIIIDPFGHHIGLVQRPAIEQSHSK
ncbi:MAG: VOC family protein [Aestuariibacter sp.]